MQDLKVRCLGSLPSGGNILDFFKFSCDSVESTNSIEFIKANYGKTRVIDLNLRNVWYFSGNKTTLGCNHWWELVHRECCHDTIVSEKHSNEPAIKRVNFSRNCK